MIKVLTVSPMYPSQDHPYFGVFVQKHENHTSIDYPVEFLSATRAHCSGSKLAKLFSYAGWAVHVLWVGLFGKYDIIHAHTVYPAGFLAVLIAMFRKKPVLITVHGSDICLIHTKSFLVRWMADLAFRQADSIQAVSLFIKSKVKAFDEDLIDKIFVQCMGVSNNVFYPSDELRKVSLYPKIIFVGSLVNKKGWKTAFKTVVTLRQNGVYCSLHVYGYGVDMEKAKLWVTTHSAIEYIFIYGAKTQVDISRAMRDGDVFLFPSMYEEAYSLVTAEALACGLPVVASSNGALPELIAGVEGSYLVEDCENHELFAVACEKALDDYRKKKDGIKVSLLRDEDSLEYASKKLFSVYNDLLKPCKPPRDMT